MVLGWKLMVLLILPHRDIENIGFATDAQIDSSFVHWFIGQEVSLVA